MDLIWPTITCCWLRPAMMINNNIHRVTGVARYSESSAGSLTSIQAIKNYYHYDCLIYAVVSR